MCINRQTQGSVHMGDREARSHLLFSCFTPAATISLPMLWRHTLENRKSIENHEDLFGLTINVLLSGSCNSLPLTIAFCILSFYLRLKISFNGLALIWKPRPRRSFKRVLALLQMSQGRRASVTARKSTLHEACQSDRFYSALPCKVLAVE